MADFNEIQGEIAQDEEIADIPVFKKNGDPYVGPDGKQATIGVYGSDAECVKAARDRIQRRMLRERRTKIEPADLRNNRIEEAKAAVARWSGWTNGEKPFEFTPANVAAMLKAEHILVQVEAGVNGHSDFFAKPSAT